MKALEIKAVIDRIGANDFAEIVRRSIQGENNGFGSLEWSVLKHPYHDPFRQELRKAVRWVVEHGMPNE